MAKKKKRVMTAAGISLETLEQTPMRVIQFLFAVNNDGNISSILALKGWGPEERTRGFSLLERATMARARDVVTDDAVSAAIAELDNWDEPNIRLIRASTKRFPEVLRHVLNGVEPVAGPGAVLNVETILKRLDSLPTENVAGAEAALAVLTKRGLDENERKRLAKLVKTAKSGTEIQDITGLEEEYIDGLLALREWYDEWSEIARLTIKRRDYLISMGLAERRSPGSEDDDEPNVDVVVDPTPFIDPTKPNG